MSHHLYCLTFPNGKKYIGLSGDVRNRLRLHCLTAKKGIRTAPIYAAIRKYGSPSVSVLCSGTLPYIADLEIKAIAAFQTRNRQLGYNVHLGGSLGPAPETRVKIGAAHRGKTISPELRAKWSAAKKGKPPWNKGIAASPEEAARLRAMRITQKMSPAERGAKISAALIGRKLSPETCAKLVPILVKARIAAKQPEAIAKMSASKKGQPTWNKGKRKTSKFGAINLHRSANL
jgi:hypothetical protein